MRDARNAHKKSPTERKKGGNEKRAISEDSNDCDISMPIAGRSNFVIFSLVELFMADAEQEHFQSIKNTRKFFMSRSRT